jgi:hypothetical protein
MSGSRMSQLINALQLLLRSIPVGSLFNSKIYIYKIFIYQLIAIFSSNFYFYLYLYLYLYF